MTTRHAVVSCARTWLGTPYHPCAMLKGKGVDCLTLLAAVYVEAGVFKEIPVHPYAKDWHLHRSQELYLQGVLKYAREIEGPPLPGDIAVWKFGRCFSHGAIVIAWPRVIHAYSGRRCMEENAERAQWLKFIGEGKYAGKLRPVKFFTCF